MRSAPGEGGPEAAARPRSGLGDEEGRQAAQLPPGAGPAGRQERAGLRVPILATSVPAQAARARRPPPGPLLAN